MTITSHLRLNIKSVVCASLLSITLSCNYILLIFVNILYRWHCIPFVSFISIIHQWLKGISWLWRKMGMIFCVIILIVILCIINQSLINIFITHKWWELTFLANYSGLFFFFKFGLSYGNNAYREEDNTRVYNRSLKDLLNSLLTTVGWFTGIESDPLPHITIKGFPWKWYRGNRIMETMHTEKKTNTPCEASTHGIAFTLLVSHPIKGGNAALGVACMMR